MKLVFSVVFCLVFKFSQPLVIPTYSTRNFQYASTNSNHHIFTHLNANTNTGLAHSGMSIDEIKSELDLRGVDYTECVSRQDLVQKLEETRVFGKLA